MSRGTNERNAEEKRPERTNAGGKIPYGRDEVKKAILDAAEKLLLEKSPNQITVREIAAAANVKHPLVHRHFGTKEDLIVAVHARGIAKVENEVARITAAEGNLHTFFEAVKKNKFRQVGLARAMIDGVDPRAIQTDFPVMRRLLDLLRKRYAEKNFETALTPEIVTAFLAAAALGWLLYEPFLLAATGLEDENLDDVQRQIVEMFEEIVKRLC